MLTENNYLLFLVWLIFGLVGSLLSQTFLLPYWIGIGAGVIYYLLRFRKKSTDLVLSPTSLVGILIILFGLIINIFVSQNPAISIEASLIWILIILVWWSARIKLLNYENKSLIWLGGLLLVFSVGLVSISTLIFPSLRLLPKINFLYATYGHNNFNLWLLISLPWVGFASQIWPSKLWKWLVGIWLAWMFLSFGRWAVAVFLLEIIGLWWWLKFDRIWSIWLKGCFGIGLVLLIMWVNWPNWWLKFDDRSEFAKKYPYLCKPVEFELRPEYWRQAIQGIKSQPLLGNGLGTFGRSSKLLRKSPQGFSNYVHNDYLQLIFEIGWLGWLVSGWLGWSWWKYRPNFSNLVSQLTPKNNLDLWFWRALWISLGGILINSLLDFDLHFMAVLVFLFIGLGWQQTNSEKEKKLSVTIKKLSQNKINLILKLEFWLQLILVVICVGWAGYFGIVNYWWLHGRRYLVWQQPYYFPSHALWLMEDFKSSSQNHQTKIFYDWLSDAENLDNLLTKYSQNFSVDQKIQAMASLYKIDPWSRLNHDLIGAYIQTNNLVAAQNILEISTAFFETSQAKNDIELNTVGVETKSLLFRQTIYLAGRAFKNNSEILGWKNLNIAKFYLPASFEKIKTTNFLIDKTNSLVLKNKALRLAEAKDWLTLDLGIYDFSLDFAPKFESR